MQRPIPVVVLALLMLASVVPAPAQAKTDDAFTYFSTGSTPNLPPGCTKNLTDSCYHMRNYINPLYSPVIDVLIVPPASPMPERDARIMRQAIEMWDAGIHYLAKDMGLDWIDEGVVFNILVDDDAITSDPLWDPEIVVIASNPVGGAGIGIMPIGFTGACKGANPLAGAPVVWDSLPGFDNHHGRSGTYVDECNGESVCFAINGAIDPEYNTINLFNLFDLVAHEVGHCLTIGHVGNGMDHTSTMVPCQDIMAYQSRCDWPSYPMRCVSTLDVEGFAIGMSQLFKDAGLIPSVLRPNHGDGTFQAQNPADHSYASSTGSPDDCVQPDVAAVPGEPVDFSPAREDVEQVPFVSITSPSDGAQVDADLLTVTGATGYTGGQESDRDGDGVLDQDDNCPDDANADQADDDADGTGDACDTGDGGFPVPDGSIKGGITIFSDLNPALAHNELASTATGLAGDPRPKFTSGEPVTFHSRFSDDSLGRVQVGTSTFTWTLFDDAGAIVDAVNCITFSDSSAATGPDGFDCEASLTLPTTPGVYFASARLDGASGVWIQDDPVDDDTHPGLKALEVLDVPPSTTSSSSVGSTDDDGDQLGPFTSTDVVGVHLVDTGAEAVTFDLEVQDMADLPPSVDLLGLGGASFKHGVVFCTASTAAAVYAAATYGAGASECYNIELTRSVLGDQVSFSVLAKDGSGCGVTPPQAPAATITGDSVRFVVPRAALLQASAPADLAGCGTWSGMTGSALADGERLTYLVGQTRSSAGLGVTLNPTLDTAGGILDPQHTFSSSALRALPGGPYSGVVGAPIAIAGSASGAAGAYTCAWSGAGAAFTDANACSTSVSFDAAGAKTIALAVNDGVASHQATAGVTVSADELPERVEIDLGGRTASTVVPGSPDGDDWMADLDLSGLPAGSYDLRAAWFAAGVPSAGTPRATHTIAVTVGDSDPCIGVTSGPTLSDIAWTAGETNVSIRWTTDVASSSRVNYGTSSSYGSSASTPGDDTQHAVYIPGLAPGTTYHYQVVSARCGYASQSVDNTFTTAGRPPSVEVTSPTASSIVQAPVTFEGTFDTGDAGQSRSGTGLVTATAGSAQWADTVEAILATPEWIDLQQALTGVKGYLGAVPTLDGEATVFVSGRVPKSAPDQVAGFDLTYVAHAEAQTLAARVAPKELLGASRLAVPDALADWQTRTAEPSGPAAPGLPDGIGPGTAMLQGVDGVQFLCSVSFVMQDANDPDQYYLSTAGHCLLANGQGIDRTGEANPGSVNNHFELCYSGCIDNALALGSYVVIERTATFEPVAYASAAPLGGADAEGIGRDFGLLRVPKELNSMLRPWMAQWGGPDGLDSSLLGDAVVHYGHGTYCCPVAGGLASRTPADQGRVAVSLGSYSDGSFQNIGWITGGDSGSPSAIGFVDADKGLRGTAALGINTHGIITGAGVFDGTLLSKGQAMVANKLGFTPRLVLANDEIGGGSDPIEPSVAFTAPAQGATVDTASVTVTGTATFPDGAGSGTQTPITYYLHRPACGGALDVNAMDLTPAAAEEAGNGCGNLGATRMANAWPATVAPGTTVPAGSAVTAHVKAFGLRPHPGVVMSGVLKANGANVGSGDSAPIDVIAVAAVLTPCTDFVLSFTTTAAFAADAQLTFEASTPQGTQDMPVCYEGGPEASRVTIAPLSPPDNVVQVSVDDATFGAGSLLAVSGTSSWSAQWDLAGVPAGEHTLHARLLQNGAAVGPVASRTVTVESAGESGLRTQLRLVGPDGEAFGWTTVQGHDGETAGTWSHAWSPASAASGPYTLSARLVDDAAVLATSERAFVIDQAPTFAMPATASLSEGEAFTLPMAASDPDGDTLTYTARLFDGSLLPEGAVLDGDLLSWTPGFEQAGFYSIVLTAFDGYLKASTVVNFTVADVNRAPVLALPGNQSVATRDTLTFTVSASDADGDDLALAAQGLPAGATFDAATGTFRWTPAAKDGSKSGTVYTVSFTASDGEADASGTVSITVTKK